LWNFEAVTLAALDATIGRQSHLSGDRAVPTLGDMFASVDLSMLLLASVIGYILGALPLADRVSRRRGVNIFLTGTGLAGSSNVLKTVGKVPAAVVLLGDMAKGIVAIFIAQALGIEGPWLVIPASAAVLGHWHSVFTRLKGGDALATFGGSTLVVFAGYGLAGVAFASVITLGARKMPFPLPFASLFSIIFGYTMIVFLSVVNYTELKVVVAFSALAVIVFAHALLGHALRRKGYESPEDVIQEPTG
jgi:acyl-phosphate glycerol 3-phosphate acyltransferase